VLSYVLVTPARNEEALIERTLASVVSQTVRPTRWIIVDDGSTDRTAAIVGVYERRYPWIMLVRCPARADRSFAGKVAAFNAGYDCLAGIAYDVIGNLDADISFDSDYFEFLLSRFERDPGLGVAGTFFVEDGYDSSRDSFEGQTHVAGGCQLFRRQCFEEVGGFIPHRAGGVDWIAVTTARMRGWKTLAFREKAFVHHRRLGTAERGVLASMFHTGQKDYYLGKHPVMQLPRVLYRMTKSPVVLGGLVLWAGYAWAWLRRRKRPITDELMDFRRREDLAKLTRIVRFTLQGRSRDKFYLLE